MILNNQTQTGWLLSMKSQNGYFEIVHLFKKISDPSGSSCKELDQSINWSLESTNSPILIPDIKMEDPNKQPQNLQAI